MPNPLRGEVWVDDQDVAMLVISVNEFNRSAMYEVVCVGVYPGDLTAEDDTPYADVVEVDGEFWTVFYDDLFVVVKNDLKDVLWTAPDEVMGALEDALREIVPPQETTQGDPATPALYPRTGEIRFADLHIPGEVSKPVVVISSEEYGQLVDHVFVVACRVTSNTVKVRKYDVQLRSQIGKVVCSHVQSVKLSDITFRGAKSTRSVTDPEAHEIRAKVFALLGL